MPSEIDKLAEMIANVAIKLILKMHHEKVIGIKYVEDMENLSAAITAAIREVIKNEGWTQETMRDLGHCPVCNRRLAHDNACPKALRDLQQKVEALENRINRLVNYISKDLDVPDSAVIDI